jgi:hypothetical protein
VTGFAAWRYVLVRDARWGIEAIARNDNSRQTAHDERLARPWPARSHSMSAIPGSWCFGTADSIAAQSTSAVTTSPSFSIASAAARDREIRGSATLIAAKPFPSSQWEMHPASPDFGGFPGGGQAEV